MQNTRIGLILPAQLEYARQILSGASEWAFAHHEVELHLLNDQGIPPDPNDLPFRPDGLLSFAHAAEVDSLKSICPHSVCVSNRTPPAGTDFVISDDHEVGRMAAEYLIRRGFRDLVYAHRNGHHYSTERRAGFQERAEESGLEVHSFDMWADKQENTLLRELGALHAKSGVFAANDITARALMHYTENPAQRIPLHYALLGVDDDPVQRSLCPLPLSSIQLDGHTIGFTAMERIMARIANPELPHEVIRIPPLSVHTRQSTDLYALEDELAILALETMDAELSELSDVSDLVKRLQISRRPLENRFRQATGRTLAKELATLRIERARDLLRNSDQSIEHIARAVGLPEARMLWLLFKRHTKESPSDYRKRALPYT